MSEVQQGEVIEDDGADYASQSDFSEFLAEQAEEYGEDNIDPNILEGLEEEGAAEKGPETPQRRRREGTDVVLRRLDKIDPEASRIMRSMQQTTSRNINEFNTLKSELLDIRAEMLAQREQGGDNTEDPATAEPTLPEGITPDHLEMFQTMADHLGYIPREELETKEREQSASSHVDSALSKGYEEYGDDFGVKNEDGSLTIHPEVQERLSSRLASLQDPSRGITPYDLFQMEFGVTAQSEPARREETPQPAPPARVAPAAQRSRPLPNTPVRRSSGGRGPTRIYDPKRGDSKEDVFDRAWAVAKRDLAGN